ncbi:MAG: DNA polymerase III subunit delta [Chloroflexi bacterium]|nr:DNA polymerase III subunit delta [Chloroflexota bacterium]
MLYMLLGQDDFSRGESLEEIKKGMGDPALLSANTTVLEGQQVTLDRLRSVCETVPFLAERRLVIIRGLLERFESKGKSGRQKKAVSLTNQQNESELWASCLSNIPDSTVLALVDDRVSGNNPLFCALSVRAEVKSFPLLRGIKLRQWIEKRVRREGGDISPEAIDLLAKLVGSNLWIIKNEIDKLTLLTSGRRIEAEDVNKVVSYAQQDSVFAMVDAVLEFKAGIAERSLKQLLERGATPAYLLVMLSRQVRMITRVRGLKNQGKSEKEIQTRLGLTLEFAFRRTLEQASRYPLARIKEVYYKLLETDLSIKTGKYEGELALNILIAELCQRAVNR